MRLNRSIAPAAVSLWLAVLLVACAQPADPTPSTPSSPSAPPPSASPTPIAPPSADPSVAPSPSPIDVVEHELPLVARATEGVDVRSLPSGDAPLLEGDRYSDMARVEIRLEADQLVQVTLGPVVADGTSWYEIRATDGGDYNFENGWVPGEILAPEGPLPETYAQMVVIYGLGSGTAVNVDVPMGTPTTVRFAAVPMADRDECEIDVTLVPTDGLGVNIATNTVTEAEAFQLAADQLSSLFMEEAGTATLQVRSDCNYSAALVQPPY